ncbi:hypothetical protein PV04_08900 [Phialophora macrospora]|uniref:DhaK domain-containing protein n=1 Tax=Phialophora macrospora TaxID=1851006 RepID=A0A0D2DNV8_9EURO|nr:hypothetical protein PV04_08900 [Phialophora macrospora]
MDSTTVPLLDLPAHYGLKVSDMVHFRSEDTASSNSDYPREDVTAGAGMLLVGKTIDALRHWEAHGIYTEEDIAKVGALVTSNVKTVHSAQVREEIQRVVGVASEASPSAWDVPRLAVEILLKGLLDTDVARDSVVHVNSNEPVVLVNLDGDKAEQMDPPKRDMLNYVVDIATTDLRSKWNIWPVRVYGGVCLPMSNPGYGQGGGDDVSVPEFSITLLNVVNTDIGGPSMPQLLDAPCDATEWSRIIRKELWRERELVSREDDVFVFDRLASDGDNASEQSLGSEDHDDDDSIGSDAPRLATLNSPPQEAATSPDPELELGKFVGGSEDDHQEVPTIEDSPGHGNQAPAPDDNPAADDGDTEAGTEEQVTPQDIPLPERRIEHPTWDRRDDSTSLLDLIKAQASMIAPFGTETAGHGIADVEGNVAESSAKVDEADVKSAKIESDSGRETVDPAAVEVRQTQEESPSDGEYVVV